MWQLPNGRIQGVVRLTCIREVRVLRGVKVGKTEVVPRRENLPRVVTEAVGAKPGIHPCFAPTVTHRIAQGPRDLRPEVLRGHPERWKSDHERRREDEHKPECPPRAQTRSDAGDVRNGTPGHIANLADHAPEPIRHVGHPPVRQMPTTRTAILVPRSRVTPWYPI